MLDKLEKEGTPKKGYIVEVVDSVDLERLKVESLDKTSGMELADVVMEDPSEASVMYGYEDTIYWAGSIFKEDIGNVEGAGRWYNLGSILEYIASNVKNHRSFDRKDEEQEFRFKLVDKGSIIVIFCMFDV